MLLCRVVFVGLILSRVGALPWRFGKDLAIRKPALFLDWQPALLGDHPGPNSFITYGFLSFLMVDSRGFQKHLLAIKLVRVNEWQCRCSGPIAVSLTKPWLYFILQRLIPRRRCLLRDFIIILSCRCYCVVSWTLDPKDYTCDGCQVWMKLHVFLKNKNKKDFGAQDEEVKAK